MVNKRAITKIKYLISMIQSCRELFQDGIDKDIIDTLNSIIKMLKEGDK